MLKIKIESKTKLESVLRFEQKGQSGLEYTLFKKKLDLKYRSLFSCRQLTKKCWIFIAQLDNSEK